MDNKPTNTPQEFNSSTLELQAAPIKPSRKIPLVIGAIFVLLIVVSVGYYLQYRSSYQVTDSVIDTQNWQSFSNDALSLKYPTAWEVIAGNPGPNGFGLTFKQVDTSSGVIYFEVKANIEPNTLEAFAAKWEDIVTGLGTEVSNKESIMVDGHNAIRYDTFFSDRDGNTYYGSDMYIDFEDYLVSAKLYGLEPNTPSLIHALYQSITLKNGISIRPKVESSLDVAQWKLLENEYVSLRYPEDWKVRETIFKEPESGGFVRISSPDSSTSMTVMFQLISGLRKDVDDWYVFTKSLEEGVSNERRLTIGTLSAKAFDTSNLQGKETIAIVTTPQYLYTVRMDPSASDVYIEKILTSLQLKRQ